MNVLIVSSENRPTSGLQKILNARSISSGEIVFEKLDQFIEKFKNIKKDFSAIIFDRVYFPFTEIIDYLHEIDCFFIVESYEFLEKFGEFNSDFAMRIYFCPLNYNLLLDDLNSITRLKEYMEFGEIDLLEVTLSLNKRALVKGVKEVYLKNKEFQLLLYLARNRGKVLSRINILENVWDMNSQLLTNTVDVHISKLRKIFSSNFGLYKMIRTVPCAGYILI